MLLTVDAVVFGYTPEKGLSIVLIQRKYTPFQGEWAIPGGFVQEHESLTEAVLRELREEAGISLTYLEQLYTFGAPERDPRSRVVSVAFVGLVRPDVYEIHADTDAEAVRWFSIKQLPSLAFDHDHIVAQALLRLQAKVTYQPIGFELLDEKFPFSDLEKLYETLLDRPIDRRNFRKKILSFDLLEELTEKSSQKGAGRPGNLFRFRKERYFQLKKTEFIFEV